MPSTKGTVKSGTKRRMWNIICRGYFRTNIIQVRGGAMKTLKKTAVLLCAGLLLMVAGSARSAVEKTKVNPGYQVRLSAATIDLVFPDGSVLYSPKDFDGKSLEGVTATEGMAKDLLDLAYEQLGLEKSASLPKSFSLSQNHPNPFNPSTTIYYTVPENSPDMVLKLTVFNIRGQLVKTLIDMPQGPGTYSVNWDGRNSDGRQVSSGIYFYRLVAGDYVSTRKMVLLK